MSEEGKLKTEILKGKIGGNYAREMVDASYVWSALDEAKKDFPIVVVNNPATITPPSLGLRADDVFKWFKKWFGDSR